jgi:hypothetical protein
MQKFPVRVFLDGGGGIVPAMDAKGPSGEKIRSSEVRHPSLHGETIRVKTDWQRRGIDEDFPTLNREGERQQLDHGFHDRENSPRHSRTIIDKDDARHLPNQ